MTEKGYYSHVERTLKKSLAVLAVVLAILFLERESLFFWGVAAGLVVAIINNFFLALRIDKMTLIAQHSPSFANVFISIGHGMRWALIGLACFFAVKTGWFSLFGMMFGFLLPSAFSVVEGIRDLFTYQAKRLN